MRVGSIHNYSIMPSLSTNSDATGSACAICWVGSSALFNPKSGVHGLLISHSSKMTQRQAENFTRTITQGLDTTFVPSFHKAPSLRFTNLDPKDPEA
jgi:hypothetical protein